MNIGTILCLLLGVAFLLYGLIFALLKEKGAILISGFNSIPKKEREKYNQSAMSKDMRNSLFLWTAIFAIGAILSEFVSSFIAILAFIIWLVLFFKNVHFDNEKAFGKYKL